MCIVRTTLLRLPADTVRLPQALNANDDQEDDEDASISECDNRSGVCSSASPSNTGGSLSSRSTDQSSVVSDPATPAELLASADLHHDEGNKWIVCVLCRTILSPRTASSRVRQVHGRAIEGLHSAIMSLRLMPISERQVEMLSTPPAHLPTRATYNCSECASAFLTRADAQSHLRSSHARNGSVCLGRGVKLCSSPQRLVQIAKAAPIGPLDDWLQEVEVK